MSKSKLIYWSPRILAIIFILITFSFSLDLFGMTFLNLSEFIIAFLMHNIISIILSILLLFSWKKNIVGAIGFLVFGLLFLAVLIPNLIYLQRDLSEILISVTFISVPIFLISLLFYLNILNDKKNL